MKNRSLLTSIFVLLFFLGQSQTILTGIVTDSSNNPIPYCSVYFSKTTKGVLANGEGAYSLSISQNGTYELICSCLGYKTHSQIVKVDGSFQKINIKLSDEAILLKEVTIKGKDKNRHENYDLFLKYFIGESVNARFCTIKNDKDLIVYRESTENCLIANSVKPLIITNFALGYEIIYDLIAFRYNLKTKHLNFSGYYYFQDISNPKRDNSRIKRNRLIAYYGSRMHFLRTLYNDSISKENFEMCDLKLDSCGTYWELNNSIQACDLRTISDNEGMTLYHYNPIVIYFTNTHQELYPLPNIYKRYTHRSRITFSDSIQVFKNGLYPDYYNLSWSGDMSMDRIAELLPYDFVPNTQRKDESKENK